MTENSDVSIFLVSDHGNVIHPQEYDGEAGDAIRFVMLTNDILNQEYGDDNTILINHDWWCVDAGYQTMFSEMRYMPMEEIERIEGEIETAFNEDDEGLTEQEYHDKHITEYIDEEMYIHPNEQQFLTVPGGEYSFDTFIWQAEMEYVDELPEYNITNLAIRDFGGFRNTMTAMGCAGRMSHDYTHGPLYDKTYDFEIDDVCQYFPAFFAAYGETVVYNGKRIHGYLPALGQLKVMYDNVDLIHRVLRKTGAGDRALQMVSYKADNGICYMDLMSSTQFDEEQAWVMSGFDKYYQPTVTSKDYRDNVANSASCVAVCPLYRVEI